MIESIVASLLSAVGAQFVAHFFQRFKAGYVPDFLIKDSQGRATAIEVKGRAPEPDLIRQLAASLRSEDNRPDRFLLITKEPPTTKEKVGLQEAFAGTGVSADWINVGRLGPALGLGEEIDLSSDQNLAAVQLAGIMGNVRAYRTAPIGVPEAPVKLEEVLRSREPASDTGARLRSALARQFPFKAISRMEQSDDQIDRQLHIGEDLENVFVLLSDIKSFSNFVRVARPSQLQEIMSEYYWRAREIVWGNGGVLDKFIGDAVLAIWGYPHYSKHSASDAVRGAAGIVALGKWLRDECRSTFDEVLELGTRVGIATGEIRVLNIGKDLVEVTFIGNAINLAARLEANCPVDGTLITNLTAEAIKKSDNAMYHIASPQEVILKADQVKGQYTEVRAWEIGSKELTAVHEISAAGAPRRPRRSTRPSGSKKRKDEHDA